MGGIGRVGVSKKREIYEKIEQKNGGPSSMCTVGEIKKMKRQNGGARPGIEREREEEK